MDQNEEGRNRVAPEEGVDAANRVIDRLQDTVEKQLKPDSGKTRVEAYGDVIEELETDPDVGAVREAGDRDPGQFGAPQSEP